MNRGILNETLHGFTVFILPRTCSDVLIEPFYSADTFLLATKRKSLFLLAAHILQHAKFWLKCCTASLTKNPSPITRTMKT